MNEFSPEDLTVVVPARDAAETIEATISSLRDQDGGIPCVIVVDDGSGDATPAIASRAGHGIQLLVVRTAGLGPGEARNRGVAAVTTPLVGFCDADDQWAADRVRLDLESFNSDDELDVLLGRSLFHADDEELLRGIRFDTGARTALIPSFGAATMRVSAFDRVGMIDGSLTNYEDYEWFYRARDLGARVVTHARVAQVRCVRADSTSRVNPPTPNDLLSVIHRSVRRRRLATGAPARRLDELGNSS